MHSTCHKQWGKFLSFFILDNCWISRCPVSNPTNSIAMETVIMYFLMWGFEIDMGERGDAVKHVSEYQSSSLAVNNDSTAALCLLLKPRWSLRESCQGNSEWNKSTVSCQEVEGDLEKQDRKPGVYRANIQICYHLCPANVYTYWMVMRGKGAVKHSSGKKNSLFCNTAFFIQNCDEKQFVGHISECNKFEM